MDDFNFLFGFYGLIFGLAIAEVAGRFADAIDAHPKVRLGWLTPLLAVFVLMNIASFWLWGWSLRQIATVEWSTVFAGLAITMSYFLATALLFPRHEGWTSLDDRWFFIWQGLYWVPLLILPFTRRKPLDLALLTALILMYLLTTTDLLPRSRWGDAVGINFPALAARAPR